METTLFDAWAGIVRTLRLTVGGCAAMVVLPRSLRLACFLLALLPSAAWPAPDASQAAPLDPRGYYGSYRFDDGIEVSGGRFDEGGAQMLLYMDTEQGRRGSTLEPGPSGFVPAFGFGQVERVRFDPDADAMHWQLPSGEWRHARRVMQPLFREAEFGSGGVSLRGTLYLPPVAAAPGSALPAVVLAHGSGPGSRHAGTWTTFFLERGLAVLAYDKRGVGESGGDWRRASYLRLAADLDAAVDWLRGQPGIDPARVGIHTSSQSGWYGPWTARRNGHVAFLIQRVGPAVDIATGTAHEMREEWRGQGLPEPDIAAAVAFWLRLHHLAREGADLAAANALLDAARQADWFGPAFGEWKAIDSPWWRRHVENMRLDPAADAAALEIPVLWFLADQDVNVPYRASLEALEAARAENPRLRVVRVEGSPHSFLIRQPDGSVRYTHQYWPVMARWLEQVVPR